jgi:hypothetical protein
MLKTAFLEMLYNPPSRSSALFEAAQLPILIKIEICAPLKPSQLILNHEGTIELRPVLQLLFLG